MGDLKVFKYSFEVSGDVDIEMPRGARVLTVQEQHGSPSMWAIVDPEQSKEVRHFRVFGTGQPLDINLVDSRYIGTFQLLEGDFIGHVFEPK